MEVRWEKLVLLEQEVTKAQDTGVEAKIKTLNTWRKDESTVAFFSLFHPHPHPAAAPGPFQPP